MTTSDDTGNPNSSRSIDDLVCVLCGTKWEPYANRCDTCGGFCTWGPAKGADPDSWIVTENGWIPRPPPKDLE